MQNNGAFGAFTTGAEIEYTIRFWDSAVAKITEQVRDKNQQLADMDDGVELRFTGRQYYAIFLVNVSYLTGHYRNKTR